jgi:hypothetical protein
MTIKQIAQRFGVKVPQLELSLADSCEKCAMTGGGNKKWCDVCKAMIVVRIKKECADDKRS